MRICFICSNLWPYTYGGAERRYYEFATELLRRGYDVAYITYRWGPSEIPLIDVGPPPQLYDEEGRRKISVELKFGYKAAKAAKKAQCDVIDATVPYTEIPLLPPEKTILTLHEYWGSKWKEYYNPLVGALLQRAEVKIIKRPKIVITPTEMIASKIRHIRPDVRALYLGIRVEEYLKYRSKEKIYDIAAVGRFVPYKGWDALLNELAKIKERLNVILIGDGPLYGKIAETARKLHHNIEIVRRATEGQKLAALGKAKFYVNMSTGEGFSISTLEAKIGRAHV